jgi:hypothetical protein
MRYRLRTLLIVLALGPPLLALVYWQRGVALGLLGGLIFSAPVFALVAMAEAIARRHRKPKG